MATPYNTTARPAPPIPPSPRPTRQNRRKPTNSPPTTSAAPVPRPRSRSRKPPLAGGGGGGSGGGPASPKTYRRSPPAPRGQRRGKLPPTVVVDTLEGAVKAVATLSKFQRVAVDCEGVQLSRTGRLCLVQIAGPDVVYFFDVVGRGDVGWGRLLFEKGGLKGLLESEDVWKVMHDCRHDSDALFHQFGVRLAPVIDTQVVFSVLRKARGMPEGLPVSMKTLLKKFAGATEEQLEVKNAVKESMRGDGDFWLKRPLPKQALVYARLDVEHLLFLTDLLGKYIHSADQTAWARVLEGSSEYVAVFRDDEHGPRKAAEQYEQMARVARRQRRAFEKNKRVELHHRSDPMKRFAFDHVRILQSLAM